MNKLMGNKLALLRKQEVIISLAIVIGILLLIVVGGVLFNAITGSSANYGINATTEPNDASHLLPSTDVPYNSLVGYWSFDFDNSTKAFDWTGNNDGGTYNEGNNGI